MKEPGKQYQLDQLLPYVDQGEPGKSDICNLSYNTGTFQSLQKFSNPVERLHFVVQELCISNIVIKPHSVCSKFKQDKGSLSSWKTKSV